MKLICVCVCVFDNAVVLVRNNWMSQFPVAAQYIQLNDKRTSVQVCFGSDSVNM